MAGSEKYLFGPVPSRRLGLSLGVDVVPFKVCTLDCVYCQVGRTTEKTIKRSEFVPADVIVAEIKSRIAQGLKADYITLSGSGEPTLNSQLGLIIEKIKKITDIPVAVLTNGTLLYMPEVRADCAKADLVMPSLDAADEETFRKINRPHPDISVEKHIQGIVDFRNEYKGPIWLEVFVAEGLNTSDEQLGYIKEAIGRIKPDRVQLNAAARPTADAGIEKISMQRLSAIAEILGPNTEIIVEFSKISVTSQDEQPTESKQKLEILLAQSLFSILKRRPCSLDDIISAMNITSDQAKQAISRLITEGRIRTEKRDGKDFYLSC